MKKIVNFIFIFVLAVVFSPLQSMADCHSDKLNNDDCHKCHEDKSNKEEEKSSKGKHDGCPMACCHMALGKVMQTQIINIDQDSLYILPPVHVSGAIRKHSEKLFRPPIA